MRRTRRAPQCSTSLSIFRHGCSLSLTYPVIAFIAISRIYVETIKTRISLRAICWYRFLAPVDDMIWFDFKHFVCFFVHSRYLYLSPCWHCCHLYWVYCFFSRHFCYSCYGPCCFWKGPRGDLFEHRENIAKTRPTNDETRRGTSSAAYRLTFLLQWEPKKTKTTLRLRVQKHNQTIYYCLGDGTISTLGVKTRELLWLIRTCHVTTQNHPKR